MLSFFREATKSLKEVTCDESDDCVRSLSFHRKSLLQVQLKCLTQVASDYYPQVTVEQVQQALKDLGSSQHVDAHVKEAMDSMNDAARLAFCRLVLREECRWETTKAPRTLNRGDSPMTRSDLIEYAGLCNGVVRLPNVQKHLSDGSKLFSDLPSETPAPIFPQKRLEHIQQQLLRAIGFDIDFGKKEIQRYFFPPTDESIDPELVHILNQLSSNMTVAITNASMEGPVLSDRDQGGVTRVVSVMYSEKIVSPDGREISTTGAPTQESIVEQTEQQQLAQLRMARQAASLEQSILGELLSMSEADRQAELDLARNAHEDFVSRAMEIPAGPERISFLTSVDPDRQRLLVTHKIWANMLAGNGEIDLLNDTD
jgi:hypothetical protein